MLVSPTEEELLSQFVEPIALYDRQGTCLYKSKRFLSTLWETSTDEKRFSRVATPSSHLYDYWQSALQQNVCEFIESQLFCSFHTMPGAETVVLRIQKCPLRLIVNSINYAAAVVNQRSEIVCYNQQFVDLLGIQPPDSFQLNQLIHPEDRNVDRSRWTDLIEGKIAAYNIEKRFLCGEQGMVWANAHIQSVAPEEIPGTEPFYTVILEDISENKANYEALILDHHRWKIFLSNQLNLFFQTNLNGRIYSASNAVVTTLGYPQEALKGMQIADLVHPRDRANFLRFLKLWGQPEHPSIMIECCFQKYRSHKEVYLYIHGQRLTGTGTVADSGIIFYAVDITERKQLEQENQAKEERYRSLVSNLPGAVYRYWSNLSNNYYAFEVISPEIERITGYAAHEFLRNPHLYQNLIVEDDRTIIEQAIARAVALQEPFAVEYQIQDALGNLRWVQDRARCVVNESGTLQWIDGVLLDVTEQKQAEELLRAVFEQAAVGINLMDQQGNLIQVNQKQCEMLGYSESELVGLPSIALTLPEEQEQKQKVLQDLLNGKIESYSADKLDVKKNGELLWVTITMSAIRERNQLKYVVTIVQDITERKWAEAQLREQEAQLQAIYESSPIGIAATDYEGKYLCANPAYQRIMGYDTAQLQQMSFHDLTYPEDLIPDAELYQKVVDGETSTYQIEKRYVRADGSVFWGRLTVAAVERPDGQVQFSFALVEDFDKQKQAEQSASHFLQLLRSSLELSTDGILLLDLHWHLIHYNQKFIELWEMSEDLLKLQDDWQLVDAMKDRVVNPEAFIAQVQEEYNSPHIEDVREWQLVNGKTYLRISRPQVIDGQVVGRVVSYREIKVCPASELP